MRQLAAAAWEISYSPLFFPSNGILAKTKNCNRVINILTASIGEEQQNYAKNNKPISGRTS